MKDSEKPEITITVSGLAGVGKSHLMYLLYMYFNVSHWDHELRVNSDYKNEEEFKEKISKSMEKVLPELRKNRKIILQEVQNNKMLNVARKNW